MIDDQAIAAITPKAHPRAGDAAREARDIFSRTLEAYESNRLTDVPKKRRVDVAKTTVWGCGVRGRAGRAGAPRALRAALSALTIRVALCGAVTVDLLRRLLVCGRTPCSIDATLSQLSASVIISSSSTKMIPCAVYARCPAGCAQK